MAKQAIAGTMKSRNPIVALLPYYSIHNVLEVGCDEAGRGCLVGPVVAAAVILPKEINLPLLNDSKKLTPSQRQILRLEIEKVAIAYSVAYIQPATIDTINILQASILAMHNAIEQLSIVPDFIVVDGNKFNPYRTIPHACIVKGDGKYNSIAAASILAKTYRDAYMQELHQLHPYYHWNTNKGYPTAAHRKAIGIHGVSPYQRTSFTFEIPN